MKSRKKSDRDSIEREIAELQVGLTELGITLKSDRLEKFETYLKFLYSYHGKIHLLSHGDYDKISRRHFLTSLAAFPFVKDHKRCCDIGAGAGFPSVPLKILLPKLDLVIFESMRKKADFLRHLVDELNLAGVQVINDRAERYAGMGFDLMLLKAVGKMKDLIGVVDRLLIRGGQAIFYKTHQVEGEIGGVKGEFRRRGFGLELKKILTPVERLQVSLVILSKL